LPETGNVFPFSCARWLSLRAYERRAATDTVTVLAWRPPHMQFQIAERGRPGEADRDTAEGEVGFSGGQGGPEQIWRCTALRSGQLNRPSGLNVGSPPHNRHSPEGCRRSVHDPERKFGLFAAPACCRRSNWFWNNRKIARKPTAGRPDLPQVCPSNIKNQNLLRSINSRKSRAINS
jgi:hypothetical protein